MGNGKKYGKAIRGMAGTMAVLMCVTTAASAVTQSLKTYVNGFFGTSSVKMIAADEGLEDVIYYESEFDSVSELVAARDAINEQVVEEGAVLLKNLGQALPLKKASKVTLLGMGSHQAMYGMCAGAAAIGNKEQIVTFETAFQERGLELNPVMISFYESLKDTYKPGGAGGWGENARSGMTIGEVPVSEYGDQQISSLSEYNDAAIIFIERNSGEGFDIAADAGQQSEADAELPQNAQKDRGVSEGILDGDGEHDGLQLQNREKELIELAKKHFDKVIILLDSSNPIECGQLQEDEGVDAILWAGAVGTKGSYGIADLLSGEENPSGGLVDTYAADNHSAPAVMNAGEFAFTNAADINNPKYGSYYIVEAEGVYVGYKYYETRYMDAVLGQGNADSEAGAYASDGNWNYAAEVVYPFGYGLSYTEFEEKVTGCTLNDEGLLVTAEVTNTGDTPGKDNVQLYLQAPYTDYDKENLVEKPFTFIGCVKTKELQPGETAEVSIKADRELLASYDYVKEQTYILEAGDYYVALGDGAHDAANNILARMGAEGMTDEQGNAVTGDENAAAVFTVDAFQRLDEGAQGSEVKNRFQDFSDLNSYQPGTVTYLSRQDWEATYPKSYTGIKAEGVSPNGVDMFAELSGDTYRPDESQTIDFKYGNPDGTAYTAAMMIGNADWDDEGWELLLNQMSLADYMALTMPLIAPADMGASAGYGASFPGLTAAEGPTGMSIGFATQKMHEETNTPYYMTPEEEKDPYISTYNCSSMHQQILLGATFNPELARRMGEIFGEDTLWCHSTGMEIGVNNHRTAYSGRNAEYFSECGNHGYIMAREEAYGIASKGGCAWIKHYFGNDQEIHRQGLATFANEAAMREIQMRACEGAFRDAGAKRCMTSFSRYGVIQAARCLPAFDVIREEWGCRENVNMTDMAFNTLMYGAASVAGGTDTFCSFSYAPDNAMSYYGILDAEHLQKDAALAKAARESAKRQLYIWANSNDANGYSSSVRFVDATTWWETALTVMRILFGLGAVAFAAAYVFMSQRREKE